MSEKPNPCNLKLVLLFNPQDESCSICSHNLTADDASQKLDELGDEGLLAVTLDQPSHHAAYNPDDCTACRAELAWLLAESAGNPRALKRALTSLPSPSTNLKPTTTEAKKRRCIIPIEENNFTHYLFSKEVVLGEACIIEKCNEWISLAFIKLGIDRPEAVIDCAFVENHTLVRKTPN